MQDVAQSYILPSFVLKSFSYHQFPCHSFVILLGRTIICPTLGLINPFPTKHLSSTHQLSAILENINHLFYSFQIKRKQIPNVLSINLLMEIVYKHMLTTPWGWKSLPNTAFFLKSVALTKLKLCTCYPFFTWYSSSLIQFQALVGKRGYRVLSGVGLDALDFNLAQLESFSMQQQRAVPRVSKVTVKFIKI